MRGIKSIVWTIILMILIFSGLFSYILIATGEVLKFFLWLFQLSLTDFGLSPTFEIVIKLLTFVISYTTVGIIFNTLNLFDSDLMKAVYFIISTLLGFALSFVVKLLQEHIIVISWSILGISIISMIVYILVLIRKRKTLKG